MGTISSVRLQFFSFAESNRLHRVSVGDEMNLVLLRLVEYLGNTNPLLSGLAYDEVKVSRRNDNIR